MRWEGFDFQPTSLCSLASRSPTSRSPRPAATAGTATYYPHFVLATTIVMRSNFAAVHPPWRSSRIVGPYRPSASLIQAKVTYHIQTRTASLLATRTRLLGRRFVTT